MATTDKKRVSKPVAKKQAGQKRMRRNSIQTSAEKEETIPVSFRLPVSARAALLEKCELAGLTPSEWVRDAVLENRTEIIARSKMTADSRELLRIYRNIANNQNQLAHRANADNLAGVLSDDVYRLILEELREQTRILKGGMRGVLDGAD